MIKTFKYILAGMAVAVAAALATGCSDDDHKEIVQRELPAQAKAFLSEYFPSAQIASAVHDTEWPGEYVVYLTDGTKVEFYDDGTWNEIDAPRGGNLPEVLLPDTIINYLAENYSDERVIGISRERGAGYEVDLGSGLDLRFDSSGKFIGYDF